MTLTLACPSCSAKLKAPESACGKKIRCPKCQAAVPVPDQSAVSPEAALPRKRRPQPSDDTDDVRQPDRQPVEDAPTRKGARTRPASKPANKVVLIGGAVALAAVIGVGIWLATRSSDDPPGGQSLAQGQTPVTPPPPGRGDPDKAQPPDQPPDKPPNQPMPMPPDDERIDLPKGKVDAATPVRLGGMEVRIKAAEIGQVTVLQRQPGTKAVTEITPPSTYLIVRFAVANRGKTTKAYHRPTEYGPALFGLSLSDDAGNHFALAFDHQQRVKGQQPAKYIDLAPGAAVEDFLVHDRAALGKGKVLLLSFPVNSVDTIGGNGDRFSERRVVFEIQQTAVKRPEQDLDPATQERVQALIDQLRGPAPEDRIKAAEELLRLGLKAKRASAALIAALSDSKEEVRVLALDALKAVNPDLHGPVAELAAALTDMDLRFLGGTGREGAVRRLAALGREARPAAPLLARYKVRLSRPGGWQQVPLVVDTLVRLAPDEPEVTKRLAEWLLKDVDDASRLAAARGLSKMSDGKTASAALAQALRGDKDRFVRQTAATALGELGADDAGAVQALTAAKTDRSAEVREAARAALAKLKK